MTTAQGETTGKKPSYWTPRRVARMAIFIALAAVGALIKIPSPTGTAALDSAPGFFSGVSFGWLEGGIVGALGHLLTAATTGFPLGIPMHLGVAVEMFLFVTLFWWVARKINIWVAVVIAVVANSVIGPLIVIPVGGLGLYTALLPGLAVSAAINIVLAAIAYLIVKRGNLI